MLLLMFLCPLRTTFCSIFPANKLNVFRFFYALTQKQKAYWRKSASHIITMKPTRNLFLSNIMALRTHCTYLHNIHTRWSYFWMSLCFAVAYPTRARRLKRMSKSPQCMSSIKIGSCTKQSPDTEWVMVQCLPTHDPHIHLHMAVEWWSKKPSEFGCQSSVITFSMIATRT